MQPSDEILSHFNVRLVAPLGGRVNQHWLVEAQGEQLVLRRWALSPLIDDSSASESISYEVALLSSLAALGWPVAPLVAGPREAAGHIWSLASFLPGELPAIDSKTHGSCAEQRARGRLLAEFHQGLAQLPELGQRPGWRRCEEVLADPALDQILTQNEQEHLETVSVLRWHLEQARIQAAGLALRDRSGLIVHGDFTPWNLRFTAGRLSGILDFELAHSDHCVGDFALSWCGRYDDVVWGYNEVSPLEPEEWQLITPLWWTQLIYQACLALQIEMPDDGWTIKKLLERSPLMGENAAEFRA